MQRLQLSDQAIRRFSAPSSVATTYWDTATKGLAIRVSPKALKTFFVLIGSGRRQTLGHYPTLSLADARKDAKRILAEKTLGSVRPTHTACEDAIAEFLQETAKTAKPRTVKDYKRLLNRHFPFGRRSVASLTNRDIIVRLKPLKPSEKHHAYTVARAFFRYCIHNGIIEKTPMENMDVPPPSKHRERVLTQPELAAVFNAALKGKTHFHSIVALLILTGQRRGEIAAIERTWRKDDTITLPETHTKNSRKHVFPLSKMAGQVLDSQTVLKDSPYFFPAMRDRSRKANATIFNSWSKSKKALDEETGVSDWTLHDLRRTFATGLARLGVTIPTIERMLNHYSGTFSGIVGVYQHHDFMDEMREAISRWDSYLQTLLKT